MTAPSQTLTAESGGYSQRPVLSRWLPVVGLGLALGLTLAGTVLGYFPVAAQIGVLFLFIVSVITLRHDAVTLGVAAIIGVMIDFYLLIDVPMHHPFVALLMLVVLVAIVFYERRLERPWQRVPDLLWWGLLIILAALAIPRSYTIKIALIYFIYAIVTAFVAWLVANLVITDLARLRTLLTILTVFAVFIAIDSMLESLFLVFPLETRAYHQLLVAEHFFLFLRNHVYDRPARASSYFLNPDSDGAFLALMFFLPLGLAIAAKSYAHKALYALAALVILLGLLSTYTAAAWIALAFGLVVLILLAVPLRQAAYAFLAALVVAGILALALPSEVSQLIAHAMTPRELSLRVGIWETALKVIRANPLTGIGLGIGSPYIARTAPYRVGMGTGARPHPQNSFLELAAMGGIPVLIAYVIVLGRSIWRAIGTYRVANADLRPMLAGVLASLTALTVNGLADATWTLLPLALMAWMLVGAISSPWVRRWVERSRTTPASPTSVTTPDTSVHAVRHATSDDELRVNSDCSPLLVTRSPESVGDISVRSKQRKVPRVNNGLTSGSVVTQFMP